MSVRVEWLAEPGAVIAGAITGLIAEVTAHDGVAPLSEEAVLRVRGATGAPAAHLAAWREHDLVGYAQLTTADGSGDGTSVAELAVQPGARGQGTGAALLAEVVTRAPAPLRVWAHGDHAAAGRLAEAHGFHRVRELLLLSRQLTEPLPEPAFAEDVTVRTFRVDADEDAWLAVNARAFAHHPEQGGWTRDDLAARMAEPWFNPAGFFVAERGGEIVGFHWTKVHGADGTPHAYGPKPVGEVYVVGVLPEAQGGGLGRALVLAGLDHLRGRGLDEVVLYVEGDNAAAVHLYERLGFTRRGIDVMYERG
jgi:mycothiol synthase